MGLAIGGHPGSQILVTIRYKIRSQLRDSAGFSPDFPRYLQRLFPAETDSPGIISFQVGMSIFFLKISSLGGSVRIGLALGPIPP
jgi:hypothetical protein